MFQPLRGIKVVDFTLAGAGPCCTKMLTELGADDVWIEPIKGASTRGHHKYDFYCANKRSMCLNLKSPEGMEIMLKLIRDADVFVTNYRMKSVKKLGLDYESLKKINPRLIYAGLTGFGTEGPEANDPGTDTVAFWGKAGLARDYAERGTLVVPPNSFGDCATGMFLAYGVMSALYHRERTGEGCDMYTSLTAMAAFLNHHAICEVQYGEEYPKSRTEPANAFLNTYQCRDGWITMTVARAEYPKYFGAVAKMIGHEELLEDPQYETVAGICGKYSVPFTKMMDEAFAAMTVEDALRKLKEINIPAARVQSTVQMLQDPQVLANKMVYPLENSRAAQDGKETILVPASPIKYRGDLEFGIANQHRGPRLGEHTAQVLQELGYAPAQIADLLAGGAVGGQ